MHIERGQGVAFDALLIAAAGAVSHGVVQALALLTWAYLVWTEAMLVASAGKSGPLVTVGLPLGVLLGYLPARGLLYYVREPYPGEVIVIAASVSHLLARVLLASSP